jgi:hypothetical protein
LETQKGNRTARIRVQIMEQLPGGEIYMYFETPHGELAPIYFSASDGRSGPKAHEKLKAILDKEAT